MECGGTEEWKPETSTTPGHVATTQKEPVVGHQKHQRHEKKTTSAVPKAHRRHKGTDNPASDPVSAGLYNSIKAQQLPTIITVDKNRNVNTRNSLYDIVIQNPPMHD